MSDYINERTRFPFLIHISSLCRLADFADPTVPEPRTGYHISGKCTRFFGLIYRKQVPWLSGADCLCILFFFFLSVLYCVTVA